MNNLTFVYFGSSRLSEIVLEELEKQGLSPALTINSARTPLPSKEELEKINADFFVVASFGKIIPKEILDIPKFGSLNVHPSLLPELRGPSPIQNTILGTHHALPGVTIIKMDEEMDHGPILAQEEVEIAPWPDHYEVVEEKLARAGGKLLVKVLENYQGLTLISISQDDSKATYVKLIKKEDGLLDLNADPEVNVRKVLAYSTWPGAYLFFKNKFNKDIRIVVKDARIKDGKFTPTKVIPAGKKEMDWEDFLRGNA